MDNEKKIEILFGAFDSELEHQEINIPNGFKAVIDGNKIILTRAESEDEQIRKELTKHLKEGVEGYMPAGDSSDYRRWLDWLEKQAEIKSDNDDIEAEEKGIRKAFNKIRDEKQGKKSQRIISAEAKEAMYDKPADKVEPKFKHGDRVRNKKSGLEQTLGSCIEDVYEGAFPFRIKDQDDWELVEQKPSWSEEDEKMKDLIISVLEVNHSKGIFKAGLRAIRTEEIVSWLKSLKHRQTVEWNPKDQGRYEDIRDVLRCCMNLDTFTQSAIEADLKWFVERYSNMKQKNYWKPSDEQMADLWNMLCECRPADHQLLQDLYYGLKKLREE